MIACYLVCRFVAYPIDFFALKLLHASSFSFKPIVLAGVRAFNEHFWSQFFPRETYLFFRDHDLLLYYRIIKVCILSFLFLLFVTSTQKIRALQVVFLGALVLWTLVLSGSGARLFYEAQFLFMIALALMIYSSSFARYKIFKIFLFMLISLNAIGLIVDMRERMYFSGKTYRALQNLKEKTQGILANKPLVVFNAPPYNLRYLRGIPQAIQLYGVSTANPLFFCKDFHINGKLDDIKQFVSIQKYDNKRIRFFSRNGEKVTFSPFPKEANIKNMSEFWVQFGAGSIVSETIFLLWAFQEEQLILFF
jgi:hypothetical protein